METLREISETLEGIKAELKDITTVFIEDDSVKNRLCGVGVLSKEDAIELCAVGPVARGSGVGQDMRMTDNHGVYKDLDF